MFSVAAMASAVLYASAVSLLPKNGETKPPPAVPPPEAKGAGQEEKKQEAEP